MANGGRNRPNGWLNRFANRLRADLQNFPANVQHSYNRIKQDGFMSWLRGRPPNVVALEFNPFEEAFRQEEVPKQWEAQWWTNEPARFKLVGDVRPVRPEVVQGVEQSGSGVDRNRPSILARRDVKRWQKLGLDSWGVDTIAEIHAAGERARQEAVDSLNQPGRNGEPHGSDVSSETLEERRAEAQRAYRGQYDKQRWDPDWQKGSFGEGR